MSLLKQYYKVGQIVERKDGRIIHNEDYNEFSKSFIIIGFPACEEVDALCPAECSNCLGLMSVDKEFRVKVCGLRFQGITHTPAFYVNKNDAKLLAEIIGSCNLSDAPLDPVGYVECVL